MTKPAAKAAKGEKRDNRPGCELLAAIAQVLSPVLLPCLLGCSTTRTLPPVPVAVSRAERTAEQAAKLSESQNWPAAAQEWKLAAERFGLLNDQAREAVALHNLAQAERKIGHAVPAGRLLEAAASLNEKLGRTNECRRVLSRSRAAVCPQRGSRRPRGRDRQSGPVFRGPEES